MNDDMQRIISDTVRSLRRLQRLLSDAEDEGDIDTIKWLWKQVLSVERRAQEREA